MPRWSQSFQPLGQYVGVGSKEQRQYSEFVHVDLLEFFPHGQTLLGYQGIFQIGDQLVHVRIVESGIVLTRKIVGLGWNLGFVAGSSLLSSGLSVEHRIRLQGVSDSVIWSSAALASASSGLVLATLGYDSLCLIGALLLVIPLRVIAKHRRSLAADS